MSRGKAVVLMYHRIGAGVLPGREPREEVYALRKESFAAQMSFLAERRCPVVSFNTVADALRGRAALPSRAVVITVDDGNATDASEIAPVLARYGFHATFFLSPARIGHSSYLSWDEVRMLHAAGMTIGAHGLDHTLLTTLSDTALISQLTEARRQIADAIGEAPRYLSLPGGAGAGDPRIMRAAQDAGYEAVATSVQSRCREREPHQMEVPRFQIRHNETLERFAALAQHSPTMLLRRELRFRIVRFKRKWRS